MLLLLSWYEIGTKGGFVNFILAKKVPVQEVYKCITVRYDSEININIIYRICSIVYKKAGRMLFFPTSGLLF